MESGLANRRGAEAARTTLAIPWQITRLLREHTRELVHVAAEKTKTQRFLSEFGNPRRESSRQISRRILPFFVRNMTRLRGRELKLTVPSRETEVVEENRKFDGDVSGVYVSTTTKCLLEEMVEKASGDLVNVRRRLGGKQVDELTDSALTHGAFEEPDLADPVDVKREETHEERSVDVNNSSAKETKYDDYSEDILQHLVSKSATVGLGVDLARHTEITPHSRSATVDWLVSVCFRSKHNNETLHLAVSYVDSVLKLADVPGDDLRLLATCGLFIATKFEETHHVSMRQAVELSGGRKKEEIVAMEFEMLQSMGFAAGRPTTNSFLQLICHTCELNESVLFLALYLSELALVEGQGFLGQSPLVLASAAVTLANVAYGSHPWSRELRQRTGFELRDLKAHVVVLHGLWASSPSSSTCVERKFKSNKYLQVATTTPCDVNAIMSL